MKIVDKPGISTKRSCALLLSHQASAMAGPAQRIAAPAAAPIAIDVVVFFPEGIK